MLDDVWRRAGDCDGGDLDNSLERMQEWGQVFVKSGASQIMGTLTEAAFQDTSQVARYCCFGTVRTVTPMAKCPTFFIRIIRG